MKQTKKDLKKNYSIRDLRERILWLIRYVRLYKKTKKKKLGRKMRKTQIRSI